MIVNNHFSRVLNVVVTYLKEVVGAIKGTLVPMTLRGRHAS